MQPPFNLFIRSLHKLRAYEDGPSKLNGVLSHFKKKNIKTIYECRVDKEEFTTMVITENSDCLVECSPGHRLTAHVFSHFQI